MKSKEILISILILAMLALITSCAPSTPVVKTFFAQPNVIDLGESSTLTWQVSGATSVTIVPGIGSVGSSGNFVISPTKTTTYTLTANNAAGSVTATVKVTVETGMKDAITVVVEEILPNIPEVQSGEPYWCLKLDTSLPSGTIIEEDSGALLKSTLKITLQEEMFFFYLDLAPNSYYAHPVKYILVDKNGNHEEYDAYWWPKINHTVPEVILKDLPDEDDVVETNVTLSAAFGTVLEYQIPLLFTQLSEGFIVVRGPMPYEACHEDGILTYLNGLNFFNAYKNAYSEVVGLEETAAAQVLNEIDDMVDEGKSVITIYIIAHGGVDSIKLGGQHFFASQFRNKMAAHPSIVFNFILGSCHSGSFIDNLSTLDNVCVVETACASDEGATVDVDEWGTNNDVNPLDVGSEWTSSLIEAMLNITQDSSKMALIQSWASNYGVPVTCMLICQAGRGALGYQPGLGLNDNFDFSNVMGWASPGHYCSFEILY